MDFLLDMIHNTQLSDFIVGDKLLQKCAHLRPEVQKEIEAWIVNTVKIQMIKKLDSYLHEEGRGNSRKLFLVPIFSIAEMTERVESQAPEIRTLFYKELIQATLEMEKKFS